MYSVFPILDVTAVIPSLLIVTIVCWRKKRFFVKCEFRNGLARYSTAHPHPTVIFNEIPSLIIGSVGAVQVQQMSNPIYL